VPVPLEDTMIIHGHGGEYAASRMLCIRENMKKGGRESLLSPPPFSCFRCAREIAFPFF